MYLKKLTVERVKCFESIELDQIRRGVLPAKD